MRKEIPKYEGKYLADTSGKIYRVYKSCVRQMKPTKNKRGILTIRLMTPTGNRKKRLVHQLIAETFLKPKPKGYSICHKNGMKSDNSLQNLMFISKKELGKRTGAQSRRKAVAKICPRALEAVEFYPSAREAGRQNFMSYQTIIDRCNGKVKSTIAPDGYIYQWDKI